MSLTDEQVQKLRASFDAAQVGKLPTVKCKACRDNKQDKHCTKHELKWCDVCGNLITTAHKHLDYVGHAHVTHRLLDVDPEWTWEPMARDANGFPVFDAQGGLWIRLTVGGVTRPGYGEPGRTGPKEAIGDAIRNAAMRFGVALELWAKGELDTPSSDEDSPAASGTSSAVAAAPAPAAGEARTDAQVEAITQLQGRLYRALGETEGKKRFAQLRKRAGDEGATLTASAADAFISDLQQALVEAEAVPA